jgi:hypothetical protein
MMTAGGSPLSKNVPARCADRRAAERGSPVPGEPSAFKTAPRLALRRYGATRAASLFSVNIDRPSLAERCRCAVPVVVSVPEGLIHRYARRFLARSVGSRLGPGLPSAGGAARQSAPLSCWDMQLVTPTTRPGGCDVH